MGKLLLVSGWVLAGITWLVTSFWMFVYYGLFWALVAFLFPPADLIAMFLVGTWPIGIAAAAAVGLGVLLEPRDAD
jgi:hypothetical protein